MTGYTVDAEPPHIVSAPGTRALIITHRKPATSEKLT